MESLKNTNDRIQAIDNFEKVFNVDEVGGQYKVMVKEGAADAAGGEIAETIHRLLNLAMVVVKDWRGETTQGRGGIVKPQEKADVQQQKKRKSPTPLEELAKTLSFPMGEGESDDWILAENVKGIKTSTLRTRRSEGERIKVEDKRIRGDESILGRDKQGRVWWKLEEDSQKVFYDKKTLPKPATRPAKKSSKTTRKK